MRIAVDIGGMSTKICVLEKETQIVHREDFAYPVNSSSFMVEENLKKIISNLKQKYKIDSIGIAAPGIVDSISGQISGLSALTDREKVNYKKSLNKEFKIPVYIENDANCAAIGEMVFGNATSFSDVVFFIIGTGMGGAVFLNKKLHKGANALAGEMGCMLQKNLETNEWYNMSTQTGMHALEAKYLQLSGTKKTGKEIYESYDNDKIAKAAIEFQIENMAKVILNTSYVIDPEAVLLGGGISQNSLFLRLLQEKVSEISDLVGMPANFKLKQCKFTNDSNIFGAGALYQVQ